MLSVQVVADTLEPTPTSTQAAIIGVKLNVDPENANVYQISPDGVIAPLRREEDGRIHIESSKGKAFLLTAPLWGGGQFPELDSSHNLVSPEQREDFTIYLDMQDLRKGQYPLDGRSIKPPWPAWVYFQAWTLGHPVLSIGGVLGLLVLFGLAVRGALAGRLPSKAKPEKKESIAGDYSLVQKIGEGGMGEVWAASSANELRCALKFIKKELAEDPVFKQRLEREIKVCLPLRHRNLLKLYGYGIATDGRMYTVSELLEGKTLKEVIAAGHYDPPQLASKVIDEVGDALNYLHTRRLVHRDVKPDNIFVCSSGEMKLMDMGLLRGEEVRTKVTHTGQMLGTPAYMPPEQMGTSGFGGFADQYSMGIIMYEILAGQRPFIQPDPILLAYQHMHVAPEPPSSRESRIPPEIEAAVLRMIAKKPEERFPSMKAAQEAFESLRFLSWKDTSEETQAGTLRKP